MISASQWSAVLVQCGVRLATAASWAPVFEKCVQAERFSTGAREIDDFTGQILHETGMLEHLEESLAYSARRLTEVWPRRFPTLADAAPYADQPEALANKTYGGRMGNVHPGDGWRYRGRGIPMVTGLDNYVLLARLTGLPLVAQPDLLSTPDVAMHCGVLWWEKKIPDAAINDVERVTFAVQGGDLGLADRALLTAKASQALNWFGRAAPAATA